MLKVLTLKIYVVYLVHAMQRSFNDWWNTVPKMVRDT
jgi:hypothetical protein